GAAEVLPWAVVEAGARHDVGQEILVDHLDAAVDHRDPDAGAVGDLPCALDVEVLARRTVALAGVLEVPLRGGQRVRAGDRVGGGGREVRLAAARFVQAAGIPVVAIAATTAAGGAQERDAGDRH